MGIVYRARQIALDRVVAIKALSAGIERDDMQLARFEQEARTMARLRHPNIVQVYDLLQVEGRHFLVLELLEGEDLYRYVQARGPLDERTAWSLIRQTAGGLAHAAQAGIVHRDVKPANILLALAEIASSSGWPGSPGGLPSPVPKITDFGLARQTQAPEGAGSGPQLTNPGAILGTPAYMAPEQFSGSDVDWRADLYALGLTTVYLLTGREPYAGLSIWDVMKQKLDGPSPIPATASPESQAMLARMLARSPEGRFGSYAELLAAIDRLLPTLGNSEPAPTVPTPLSPRQPSVPRPSRRWVLFAGVGLVTTAALVRGLFWWRGSSPVEPPVLKTGRTISLFSGLNLNGWLVGSGVWQPTIDEEGGAVLSGSGWIRRPLPPLPSYRFWMGVDRRDAQAVEVHFGLRADPSANRQVLRISAESIQLGIQSGANGPFRQTEKLPRTTETTGTILSPYREVRVDRTPLGWFAYYHGKLVGHFPLQAEEIPELQFRCEGGPAYFESIEILELLPNP